MIRRAASVFVRAGLWTLGASALVISCFVSGRVEAGNIELISRAASPDDTVDAPSGNASFSADGRYVVFTSRAANLVSLVTDGNGADDVFLFDRVAGTTILVSASAASPGQTAHGASTFPSISADGRYIVYQSNATDLVPGQADLNGTTNVFLFDRMTGATVLVSHVPGSGLVAGSGVSQNAVVSGDGRYVAFESRSTNLVTGQVSSPLGSNVFLWDRASGTIALVSHAAGSATTGGSSDSRFPLISADGSAIVFFSFASDLVAGQSPSFGAVYAFDVASASTTLVSHAAGSPTTPANATTDAASMSTDGRYVVLRSSASNLISGQVNSSPFTNLFLYDRALDTTVLVSRKAGSSSITASPSADFGKVSADGQFVAFVSDASDLVDGFVDGNGASKDVFLFDRQAGTVSLVSRSQGSPTKGANGGSLLTDISADGRWIAFSSRGTDVVDGQVGGAGLDKAFVFDRNSGTSILASHSAGSPLVVCNNDSFPSVLSADGAFLILDSFATDVQAGIADHRGAGNLYLFERAAGTNTLVSRRAPELPSVSGDGLSIASAAPGAISADGRFVGYVSWSNNLVGGQVGSTANPNIFVSDRLTRASTLVSHAAGSLTTPANGPSQDFPSLSADGRWLAFTSFASDLVAGVVDTTGQTDVFLHDGLSGTNALITRGAGTAVAANAASSEAVVSRDGRFVAFSSLATDLVAGQSDANGSQDVFLYGRDSGSTVLASHLPNSTTSTGNGSSFSPAISRDGAFVAFLSGATNLAGARSGAFLFETATGLATFAGPADTSGFRPLALSEDGNWVAFTSSAANVVPGQVGGGQLANVYLFSRLTGSTTLVSHRFDSAVTTGGGTSWQPSLSADGRFVAFASNAADLVPNGDTFFQEDVFLFDRADNSIRLVSAANDGTGTGANGVSSLPSVSSDGSRVAFLSTATNLVPGQVAPPGAAKRNVFLHTIASGITILASGSGSSTTTTGNDDAFQPTISSDGSVLAYESFASDLVPGDLNSTSDVFAFQVAFSAPQTSFYPLVPCRVVDTRGTAGPYGAPALLPSASRTFTLVTRCGVPLDAVAVSANVTVVDPASSGFLSFHPAGFASALASTISYAAGQVRGNNAILGLGAAGGTTVDLSGSGAAHVVVDVNGYFK